MHKPSFVQKMRNYLQSKCFMHIDTKEGLEGSKTIVDIAFAAKLIAPFLKPHILLKKFAFIVSFDMY